MLGPERLEKLIASFCSQAEDLLEQLERADMADNQRQCAEVAHKLAGASANFGLEYLSQCCKSLEHTAEQSNEPLGEQITSARNAYEQSQRALQAFMNDVT